MDYGKLEENEAFLDWVKTNDTGNHNVDSERFLKHLQQIQTTYKRKLRIQKIIEGFCFLVHGLYGYLMYDLYELRTLLICVLIPVSLYLLYLFRVSVLHLGWIILNGLFHAIILLVLSDQSIFTIGVGGSLILISIILIKTEMTILKMVSDPKFLMLTNVALMMSQKKDKQ